MISTGLVSGYDSSGIYGGIYSYAIIFSIVGSSLLAFLYLWAKGRLDMDEEPKMQMMQEEQEKSNDDTRWL